MVSEESRFGLGILATAVVLGGAHDLMLGGHPLGINLLVAITIDAAAVAMLARWRGEGLSIREQCGVLLLILFSAAVAIRDSPVLIGLDLLALAAIATGISLVRHGLPDADSRSGITAGIAAYLRGAFGLAGRAAFGATELIRERIEWKELEGGSWNHRAVALLRGGLLALPVVIVFGLLLASADGAFSHLLGEIFKVKFDAVATHAVWSAAFAWGLAGIFSGVFARASTGPEAEPVAGAQPVSDAEPLSAADRIAGAVEPAIPRIGSTEVAVVLAAVDLLFLAFVIVQLPYFFGGAEFVREAVGVTMSDYARRGFFELVAVAAIELPLLLTLDWVHRRGSPRGNRVVTLLAVVQVLLVLVLLASALDRMRVYQITFGQTELRFYTSAFMWWLAALFVWFSVTVLRGARPRFAPGAALTALATIIVLNLINPDAWIARANFDMIDHGRMPDLHYLMELSADAVPTIVERLERLDPTRGALLENVLIARWKRESGDDWRSWNWSRAVAHEVMLAAPPLPVPAVGSDLSGPGTLPAPSETAIPEPAMPMPAIPAPPAVESSAYPDEEFIPDGSSFHRPDTIERPGRRAATAEPDRPVRRRPR